jgi:subfamily B ATP-binding cassette protein MsbA
MANRQDKGVVWREARDIVWERRYRLALGLILMVFGRLSALVLPATSKYLIDEVIGQGRAELLVPLATAAGIATLVQASTGFANSQILGVAAQQAITEMRKTVHDHVLRLPTAYFDSVKSGELISRIMTDAEGIRNLVGTGLVQLAGGLLTASIALSVLFYLNWRLTSLTLIVLAAFGGMMALAFAKLRPLFRARGALNATATGRLGEALGGIRIVKAYNSEERESGIFGANVDALFRNVKKSVTAVAGISSGSTLIFGVVGVLMILVGGRAMLEGTMTLGDFVMYIFFTGLVAAPLVQISSISTQLSEAFAGLDRIREIRALVTEDADDDSRATLSTVTGDIEFDDVSFEYQEGVPVLKHISFEASSGTTTALVGSSGSGKSTLASLVLAFNRPQSGRVLIDGHDVASVRLSDYRSHVGVVLQDNFLFDGTIAENIAYARPDATDEEIREVSRIAHSHEFIVGFDDGYDTVVGERGVKVSGGQRQRIAIARAILADPKILILDEATSSLDSESESLIQDGLRTLRSGRTTFVIAHRLSTIVSADQILVIEDGEIVERGNHATLLAQNGRYRELYDRQYRLELDRFINPGEDFTPEPEKPETTGASFNPRGNL